WLLAKECRRRGDCISDRRDVTPGGWYFEFNNDFYPDVDDTAMVVMALGESLGGLDGLPGAYSAEIIPAGRNGSHDSATIVAGVTSANGSGVADVDALKPSLDAIRRGTQWMLAMQSRNGGWGAFDADNTRELLTRVPFADHNAMIDPP